VRERGAAWRGGKEVRCGVVGGKEGRRGRRPATVRRGAAGVRGAVRAVVQRDWRGVTDL
jgi:hypothetical protein